MPADARLLIITYADNKHLIGGKTTKKNLFKKLAEQFTKASGRLFKRQRGACERMGLVTNGTHSSQTEIPNRNFWEIFVNGKRPRSPCILLGHLRCLASGLCSLPYSFYFILWSGHDLP